MDCKLVEDRRHEGLLHPTPQTGCALLTSSGTTFSAQYERPLGLSNVVSLGLHERVLLYCLVISKIVNPINIGCLIDY